MSIVDKMNEILDKQKERDNGGIIIPKIKEYVTKPGAPNPKVVDIFAANWDLVDILGYAGLSFCRLFAKQGLH